MEIPVTVHKVRDMSETAPLPESLRACCKQIAREITEHCEAVRDERVLAARVRICSGYYDSEEVLHLIADRLISEGRTRPPSN
jgi:hypothetical protein